MTQKTLYILVDEIKTVGDMIQELSAHPIDADLEFHYDDRSCEIEVRYDPDMTAEEKAERALYKQLKAKYEGK